MTYNNWDKLIAVSDMDSYGVVQTVKDSNSYVSYSGFATAVLDWKGAELDNNGDPTNVDSSVNNYFIDNSGAVTKDPTLANGISRDWNLTDEKIETTISGIMTGTAVSRMPYSIVAGDKDINAVDANISILQNDGSWKQVALNLATDSSIVSILEAGSNGSYKTMTLDDISLPMSFALEFEPPEISAQANPLMGNISDGTNTDNINQEQSFFKDGFLYLQTLSTNLGYKHIVIDLVNNVGYAFTDYVQVSIDANGVKQGEDGYDSTTAALYWTMERTKVNFAQ